MEISPKQKPRRLSRKMINAKLSQHFQWEKVPYDHLQFLSQRCQRHCQKCRCRLKIESTKRPQVMERGTPHVSRTTNFQNIQRNLIDARQKFKVLQKRKERMDDISNALKNRPDKSSFSEGGNSDRDMDVTVKTEAHNEADAEAFRVELNVEYSQVRYYLPKKVLRHPMYRTAHWQI